MAEDPLCGGLLHETLNTTLIVEPKYAQDAVSGRSLSPRPAASNIAFTVNYTPAVLAACSRKKVAVNSNPSAKETLGVQFSCCFALSIFR